MTDKTTLNLVNDDITVNSLTAIGSVSGNFVGNGSGLTNLKPTISKDHVRASLFLNTGINDSLVFTQPPVFPDTINLSLNTGAYTSNFNGIIVPSDGYYLAFFSIRQDSTIQRSSVQATFTINGTPQLEVASTGYIRSANDHNESSVHLSTIYNLVAGDELGLAFRRDPDGQEGNTGTVTLTGTSQVSVYHIGV